ncbi:hypothetical protein [Nocardioides aequoreus]|uniref:hypothetical protein n=1 Tax=Nocardioides aequoreus TaxID=397278 RepID=UPI0004C45D6B|nr:hypothetical protein [Nocardioides aequoreus]
MSTAAKPAGASYLIAASKPTATSKPTGPGAKRVGRGRRCLHAMVDDLAHVTVQQAAELARASWELMSLYPGDVETILETVQVIEQWAHANNAPDLRDLDADKMLRKLAGAKTLDGYLSPKKLDRLHLLRNTLSALRGTVLLHMTNPRKRSDRPAHDSLDRGLPTLPPRYDRARRPMTDDEILLGNILVEIDLHENAPLLPITAYLIGAAGVHTMESTALTTDHLNHRTEPTKIHAKGLWGWSGRTVSLDTFTAHALARTLSTNAPGTQRLTYTGTSPGTKEACASLNPVVTRFLRRAGVADPDVTVKSLTVARPWRIILHDRDFKTARKIHGGKTNNLLNDISCTIEETDHHKGKILLLDKESGHPVAKVKARHVAEIPACS